ncbi:MAG: ribonuclease III [Candidatus Blackburnbacteria bacterium]|nr:ribonuclease III [Candidatus Blackburnbacteria bacterium]MBI2590682.1 ribonuclease III [Candidatus Blackburnbacteria bacterium]
MSFNDEAELEKKTDIVFQDKKLLHQAFIHRSFLNENPETKESNERLEFLGDAVLEFVVSESLFEKFKKEDEGHLTALRAKLVNTISLAETATELGVGRLLYLSRGEEKSGGRSNSGLLADTVEALIGAIFIDQGIEKASLFIQKFILKKLPEVVKTSLKDPKSMLQEFVQANGYPTPVYRVVKELGPDHAKEFTVEVLVGGKSYAKGIGPSKQIATQEAAQEALKIWTNKTG